MENHGPTPSNQDSSTVEPQQVPDNTRELLQQVLEAVTSSQRSGRLQALTAIILSLATLTTTWCGYQAARWSDDQSQYQSASDTAERQAAENTLAGLQVRTQDGLLILEYWRAQRAGDERTHKTVFAHMRPELQRALETSIREGILENPSVPGPLQQKEYSLEVETLASAQRREARAAGDQAAVAGQVSSEYVLLTLMLASVLFVGGVSSTFSRASVRRSLGVVAFLVFAVAIVGVLRLPVLWPLSGGTA